jgi:hypothetical protein
MAGSDKLKTSQQTWDRTGKGGVQRNPFFKTGPFDPVLTFYDISGVGMHLSGTRKTGGVALWRQRWDAKVRLPLRTICNPPKPR